MSPFEDIHKYCYMNENLPQVDRYFPRVHLINKNMTYLIDGTQPANTIKSGPSGTSGEPSYRHLVSSDLPTSGITAGTYSSLTVDVYGRAIAGNNVNFTQVALPVTSPTTNYSVQSTDYIILANGNITITLPSASSGGIGDNYIIKRISNNIVNVVVSGGGTIDGNTTIQLTSIYASINVVSDGTAWWIF